MTNKEDLRSFLREWYLYSRFEGRDGVQGWPKNYSSILVDKDLEHLEKYGKSMIGMYESRTGKPIEYDSDLNILNADVAPPQIQARASSISRIAHGQHW